ncbi:MAG: hypothetical protein JWM76_4407, partial [Pseudonocardiales bacterium]|nr:hypothetical protein [Pseudonocardiales bacterium]
AGQQTATQRGIGHGTESEPIDGREEFSLSVTRNQAVLELSSDEG